MSRSYKKERKGTLISVSKEKSTSITRNLPIRMARVQKAISTKRKETLINILKESYQHSKFETYLLGLFQNPKDRSYKKERKGTLINIPKDFYNPNPKLTFQNGLKVQKAVPKKKRTLVAFLEKEYHPPIQFKTYVLGKF